MPLSLCPIRPIWPALAACIVLACAGGCGTTRTTDTSRTATEQLLISDAIDRTVQHIDFRDLAGRKVYLDDTYLSGVVDDDYLISTLRQHLLATGCILADSRSEATYVLEARAGSVGTNRHDVLFGTPAINMPSFVALAGMPTSIPEIPIVKKSDRRGLAKLAVFAYHRDTGAPVWQSGIVQNESTGKDYWVLGAGPFQWGSIHEGTAFAGSQIRIPLVRNEGEQEAYKPNVLLAEQKLFERRSATIARLPRPSESDDAQEKQQNDSAE